MSEQIVAGIGLIIDNQEIEKCITEKFKASSDTYYRNHKKIQNMISEKDFIEVINHVSVRFDNENMFMLHLLQKPVMSVMMLRIFF